MAYAAQPRTRWTRDRLIAAVAAIAVQAALGYVLITGLAVQFSRAVEDGLKLFTAAPPPDPPPAVIPPPRTTSNRPEGRASAPNLRSRATAVAAPEAIVITPPPPPPVIAAPKPFVENDFMSGSAPVRGPGTGAGGSGNGFGSGGSGDGDGAGGYGEEVGPQFVRGRMSTSDLPESLFITGFNGTVGVRYLVLTSGRVSQCIVTQSSGNAVVDAVTCRLIRERFRFRPARDGRGRPVPAWIVENHSWEVEADIPEEELQARPRTRRW